MGSNYDQAYTVSVITAYNYDYYLLLKASLSVCRTGNRRGSSLIAVLQQCYRNHEMYFIQYIWSYTRENARTV